MLSRTVSRWTPTTVTSMSSPIRMVSPTRRVRTSMMEPFRGLCRGPLRNTSPPRIAGHAPGLAFRRPPAREPRSGDQAATYRIGALVVQDHLRAHPGAVVDHDGRKEVCRRTL